VVTSFETVKHAAERGGPHAYGLAQFGDRAAATIGEVGQGVDLGGGQIEIDEVGGKNLQSGMGSPLQSKQG
jgi:hypothetical protein